MYKQGNTQELISEYYAFRFLKAIGVRTAEYQIHRTTSEETGLETVCIVTKDFTNNANFDFEPFCNYYSDREEPEYILAKLPESMHPAYVMMLFYDALLFNGDRHNQNVGFLRSSETGQILELAPYFDFNLSLASVVIPRIDTEAGNVFTREFLLNDICCRILKKHLPERNLIQHAISKATAKPADTATLTPACAPSINASLMTSLTSSAEEMPSSAAFAITSDAISRKAH